MIANNPFPDTPGGLKMALAVLPHRTRLEGANSFTLNAAGGADTTLATLTGPGVVKKLWLTTFIAGIGWYSQLKIYVDGSATPIGGANGLEIGTLALSSNASDLSRRARTKHWEGTYGEGGMTLLVLEFPIPFASSLVIKASSPAGSGILAGDPIFLNTYWTPDIASNLRLGAAINPRNADASGIVTIAYNATADYLNLGSGTGWIVGHMAYRDLFGITALERNHRIYIDGEASPSWESSGSEDTLLDSYYWQRAIQGGNEPPINRDAASLAYVSDTDYGSTTPGAGYQGLQYAYCRDFLADLGGVMFNNGVIFRLNNDGTTAGHGENYRQCTLYYTR